ncbi:hypothetical protein SAMN05421812_10585 [Asanoa hainanensis]|uniref:Uncharacterized protein n=1 Tax=Asanoa hainanensis TaxID=560556 RepID=A0A239M4R6_9ACTN|nr:hypothetical protein SAMN05421812_10585 [Asanoa hainanensis]
MVVAVALVVGFVTARLGVDPHTAETETVTGVVTWSNEETRLIFFQQDGVPPGSEAIVSVTADNWQDAGGMIYTGGPYPTCLAGADGDPVSMDRHRVELQVIHRAMSAGPAQHFAVQVHCLD